MLRKHHNLTQTEVANILGVGQRIVMRWETE
ncbi:XRE family transcriptional regulator, partial [Mannheimia haemolytica]|nr:XRE family transcriptional regulator [Mannheimia haemolytica]